VSLDRSYGIPLFQKELKAPEIKSFALQKSALSYGSKGVLKSYLNN
jgi:hypothetical protein